MSIPKSILINFRYHVSVCGLITEVGEERANSSVIMF